MSKRKPITKKMAVDALLRAVLVQFGGYLRCSLSGIEVKPGDVVQFDHTHCVGLDGPHIADNLRPVLVKPHQKKTKADLRMIKKTRPGHAGKFVVTRTIHHEPGNPITVEMKLPSRDKPKRKIASRGFQEKPEGFKHNWRKA